ncbi:glycosyltransferase family 2 protein [Oculatella sp. LEGE 06141]|uniref:glycosyltransferase family 2 protein n=1 Tax=Oculatella sp. LEGE 06141 TaxID=1828648 RepID=UPI001883007A|nr:glycosyltransferase family 2 protein [Oculatella sp. LEGE 06141]MBE9178914.1 glycosyltransferase family 2 protein [Oculatella sp. LEGE 06141]
MTNVSVVIPVYNVERYIALTVQSVLNQTYTDFELLIVDDGSPDRSSDICQQFDDPRIKLIQQQNRGLAGARNTGIRHAQGQYIAFLDGDDLWLPEQLEKQIAHLERSPDVGVSFCRSEFMNEVGDRLGTYTMPQLTNIDVPCLLRGSPISNGSAVVVRRQVFDAIQFEANLHGTTEVFYFDEQFRRSEDIECWLRIAIQTTWKIEGIPEALTLYRVNSGGLSASFFKQLASWEQVLEKMRSYAPEQVAQYESLAMAYQYRYLARSAVRMGDGRVAFDLIHRALFVYWHIVLEEPRRTILTWAAACMLRLLPSAVYSSLSGLATKRVGARQKRQILRDQAEQSA